MGNCPSLYEADNGDIVVQGYELNDAAARADLHDVLPGENFVVVPRSLLDWYKSNG
jgi:hypothetical protein